MYVKDGWLCFDNGSELIHVDDGGGFPGLTPGGHVTNSCETLWSETKALSPAHRNELAEFMIGRWKAWADGTGV